MENRYLSFPKTFFGILIAAVLFGALSTQSVAQSGGKSYQLLPAPDVWYNSVDGVRVGARVLGQTPGSFGDGPHRLKAGVWLGTKFPENPVSYYLQFTEPIPAISDFGSEGNIRLQTSYRTGFQSHGLSFNKRWQTGFNENNYKELSLGFRAEHRFDKDYLLYSQLWQDDWLYMAFTDFQMTDVNNIGRYLLSLSASGNIAGQVESFLRWEVSFQQQLELSEHFILYGRLYTGLATEYTAPEYRFSRSFDSARMWMDRGLTRARGTIPPNWFQIGNIEVTGGANLRGYTKQDVQILNAGFTPLLTSLSSVNLELDYPNPLNKAIGEIPVIGGLIKLRSYIFFDAGTSLVPSTFEETRTLADAGLGFLFSINIPDYLGKPRGIAIRYDLPFWLSHPGMDNSIDFRNVIGIGAVISL